MGLLPRPTRHTASLVSLLCVNSATPVPKTRRLGSSSPFGHGSSSSLSYSASYPPLSSPAPSPQSGLPPLPSPSPTSPYAVVSPPFGSALWESHSAPRLASQSQRYNSHSLHVCRVLLTWTQGTAISDRVISLAGVYFFQLAICGISTNRTRINW